jgi:hypothetical protein
MKTITYRKIKDLEDGKYWYLVGGIAYKSLNTLKAVYPKTQLKRIKGRPLYG